MRVLSALVAFFAFFQVVRCGDMHNSPWVRRHNSRTPKVGTRNITNLTKREFNGARLTFYAPGLGACGITNTAADSVSFLLYEYQVGQSIIMINSRSLPSILL